MKRIALGLVVAAATSGAAHAALLTEITGIAGSGVATFTLSGSAVASQAGLFGNTGSNGIPDFQSQFRDLGDVTPSNLALFESLSGTATISVDRGAAVEEAAIASVLLDSDGDGLDDIGFALAGDADLAFDAGDVISFSGAFDVAGLDLGDLSETALPSLFTSQAGLGDALDFRLSVAASEVPDVAPVPVPAGLPLLAGALGLLALRRRRG